MNRSFLQHRLMQAVLEVATGAAANADPTASVAGESTSAAEARKRAAAANFLPIVRGRLPLLFVHAIRFDKVLSAMSNKDLASKFATSVGKVFDIKKGRNFAYVDATFKPSAEDVSAAEAWIAQVGATNGKGIAATGDKSLMQSTLDQYKAAGLATAAEAAAFSAARGATRVKTEKPATAAASAAGEAKTEGTGEGVAAATGSADDLLG